jgi:K+-transporting ATPase ATPase C chain
VHRVAVPALRMLAALTLLTGVLYPALVTAAAALLFPGRATGSLVTRGGAVVGSRLIGQPFSDPRYFWGRPSATAPLPYDATASGGSNLAPSNPAFAAAVRERIAALRAADPRHPAPVPVDLVTASASGLDPHISPAAAAYQIARVARARGISEQVVRALVAAHTFPRELGVLGEPRVEVLSLNLALDDLR